jgi:hypothetical protein
LSEVTSHHRPTDNEDQCTMLDNIEDCVVCHDCLHLPDVPSAFEQDPSLFLRTDILETKCRSFAYDYYQNSSCVISDKCSSQYSSLNYGYYFVVLYNRMNSIIQSQKSKDHNKFLSKNTKDPKQIQDNEKSNQQDQNQIQNSKLNPNNEKLIIPECPRAVSRVYIQVTSDSVLTPQLKSMGLDKQATRRPVWGSVIAYELYMNQVSVK